MDSVFKYLDIAVAELGQKVVPGTGNNPRIVEYATATTLKASDDETPWCASFVNWCLLRAGLKGTGSARALSFANWGVGCSACLGAVAVIDYGGGKGHVAFVVGKTPKNELVLLGGNQSKSVKYKSVNPLAINAQYRMPTPALPILDVQADGMGFSDTR